MDISPSTVRVAHALILFNAILWLAFGILIGIGVHPSFAQPSVARWGMAITSLFAAGFLTMLAMFLKKRNRIAFWIAVTVLAGMAVAGTLEEIGLADLAFVMVALFPLVLLIKDRNWCLIGV
jgi:hypothetical protein